MSSPDAPVERFSEASGAEKFHPGSLHCYLPKSLFCKELRAGEQGGPQAPGGCCWWPEASHFISVSSLAK